MKNKRLEEGDIFYVLVNDKYIFARLLLDVDTRILKSEPNHYCKFFAGCYLIEVYKGIYDNPNLTTKEIILPSQFTLKKYFYSKNYNIEWVFYEHEPIDFSKLDFPELLETGNKGIINFRKFEVSLPTKTIFEDFPTNQINGNQKYTGTICSSFYQMIDESFHLQNRDDLMRTKRTHFLDNSDLRLNENDRKQFFNQINEPLNIPYYDLSLKQGFDLGRFYR